LKLHLQPLPKPKSPRWEANRYTISTADLESAHWATRSMPVEWQTDRFIRTASCEAVWYGWI